MSKSRVILLILIITFIGFSLRIYRLGESSLSNDEVGQALAALKPGVMDTLAYSRWHTMAMPLDYLVSRAAIRIDSSEFTLHLPSAIWGTLALIAFFDLARRLSGIKTAIVATLLLSVSPLHIRYAQEMRFYAALGFFYLLANVALIKAIQRPNLTHWLLFILATLVGSYFHVFVALTVVNGFTYWLFSEETQLKRWKLYAQLLTCSLVLAALIAPGYWYFGGNRIFQYNLLQFGGSVPSTILQGIGWRSFPFTPSTPAFGAWEALNAVFATIGAISLAAQWRKHRWLAGMIFGVLLNIGLILLADTLKGYWFVSRQLVHLAPFAMLLTAMGISFAASAISILQLPTQRARSASSIFLTISILAICLTSGQRLVQYFAFPKSQAKQIVAAFLETQQGQEPLFVIPAHEEKIYSYYLIQAGRPDTIRRITPVDWLALPNLLSAAPSRVYLAVQGIETINHSGMLRLLGFEPLWQPHEIWYGSHTLWVRNQPNDLTSQPQLLSASP